MVTSTHSHGPSGEHTHKDYAFTTWLDPILAIKQAESIMIALERQNPRNKTIFQTNFENLKQDLIDINKKLSTVIKSDPNKPILTSHPVYQYLEARFGLNFNSLHLEPGEYPDKNQIAEIENMLNDKPYRWIIWEKTPLNETINTLEQFGINSVVFNTLANKPDKGDYLSIMHLNIENLKSIYN